MTGSNAGHGAEIDEDLGADMLAFDALPRRLRFTLAYSPVNFSAIELTEIMGAENLNSLQAEQFVKICAKKMLEGC